jgi:5-(carboxyamino)imidazole ribonucleotide synthase
MLSRSPHNSLSAMIFPPGSTIGIIGGGQLGRMLSMAAATLGYRTHIYAPEPSGPAADVCAAWTQGDYHDLAMLSHFASQCQVITFEFENVDLRSIEELAAAHLVRPHPRALAVAQDRVAEKRFVEALNGETAAWLPVDHAAMLAEAVTKLGPPLILKTKRFGYDGKGQARIIAADDAAAAWQEIKAQPAIAEQKIDFVHEFSVLAVRTGDGQIAYWDSPENVHQQGILARSTVPAPALVQAQTARARELVREIMTALDYVGVLAVEFFATEAGPLFNEMAPRVHNSGHWTIEGAVTSQFANHIRAICGLPLGATALTGQQIELHNLIGDDADRWHTILGDPTAHLHLYGKNDARPGRKMGHICRVR